MVFHGGESIDVGGRPCSFSLPLTSDFVYAIDVTVPWSVCLADVTFMHCAQTAENKSYQQIK